MRIEIMLQAKIMREIKFRIWDCREMIYKSDFNNYEITLEGKIHFYQSCPDGDFGTNYNGPGNGFKLMQYTGLKDKNGKEIYEGDIVKIRHYEAIGEVIAVPGHFWIKEINTCVDGDTQWSPDMAEEVIGNIYENPELLNG